MSPKRSKSTLPMADLARNTVLAAERLQSSEGSSKKCLLYKRIWPVLFLVFPSPSPTHGRAPQLVICTGIFQQNNIWSWSSTSSHFTISLI